MFYDLIYTRCRHGVDILRSGQAILSDGFKVYSCSSAIYKENIVDLQYLMNSVQKKQSFNEPDFMDDAYLYSVPDTGMKILNEFHPVPYDLSVTGDFAKRPGMYLNHSLIGSFENIYPYETFHSKMVWTAQNNNEAYYYEQEPADILPRDISVDEPVYSYEVIGEFIEDGRKEALKKTVSFLLNQYTLPIEKRKYIVIKDETSANIEMWIAAIELAFSPRIASNISFATRLDKYVTTNVYYVNEDGVFSLQQTQDDNNSARYRASIIGVVSKDKANSVKTIDASQFVVLDGEKKQALFDCPIKGTYYQIITSYDDMHIRFSKEFLQSFDISDVSPDIKQLADSYEALCGSSFGSPTEYSAALGNMSKYSFKFTPIMKEIYDKVNARLDQFVKSDLKNSISILSWIGKAAIDIGDDEAESRISSIVVGSAESLFFKEYKKGSFIELWLNVKGGPFEKDVARLFNDQQKMIKYKDVIWSYEGQDAATFLDAYCVACKDQVESGGEKEKRIIAHCIAEASKESYSELSKGAISALKSILNNDAFVYIIESVRSYEPKSLDNAINHIMKYGLDKNTDVDDVIAICAAFDKADMNSKSHTLMKTYVDKNKDPLEIDFITKRLKENSSLDNVSKKNMFEMLDAEIDIVSADSDIIAASIQNNKPKDAKCMNSAHLAVLDILNKMKKGDKVDDRLLVFVKQGFPSVNRQTYISRFTNAALNADMTVGDYEWLLNIIGAANDAYAKQYMISLVNGVQRYKEKWDITITFISECSDLKKRRKLEKALSDSLVDSEMKKKDVESLSKLLTNKSARKYYDSFIEEVEDAIKERDGSAVSRFFGRLRK